MNALNHIIDSLPHGFKRRMLIQINNELDNADLELKDAKDEATIKEVFDKLLVLNFMSDTVIKLKSWK